MRTYSLSLLLPLYLGALVPTVCADAGSNGQLARRGGIIDNLVDQTSILVSRKM